MTALMCQERTTTGDRCYLGIIEHRHITDLDGRERLQHAATWHGERVVWTTPVEKKEESMEPEPKRYRVITNEENGSTFREIKAERAEITEYGNTPVLRFMTGMRAVAAFYIWASFEEIAREEA